MTPDKLTSRNLEQWFAAYTFSCQEKRVAQHLSMRRIEFFLPVHRKISLWKNGLRTPIEWPLFPGYVFVKMDCKDRVRVLELPGVHSIVGAGSKPVPLPYEEIETLRHGMHLVNAEPHPIIESGEKVLIGFTARTCPSLSRGLKQPFRSVSNAQHFQPVILRAQFVDRR